MSCYHCKGPSHRDHGHHQSNHRDRHGSPYPSPRFQSRPPPAPRQPQRDTLDTFSDIAVAGTTSQVGKEIRAAIARVATTPSRRIRLIQDIHQNPKAFYERIGFKNVLEKTVESVGRSAGGPVRNARSGAHSANTVGTSQETKQFNDNIIKVLTELVNVTNANAVMLHQAISTSNQASAAPIIGNNPPLLVPVIPVDAAPTNPNIFEDIFGPMSDEDMHMEDDAAVDISEPHSEFDIVDEVVAPQSDATA